MSNTLYVPFEFKGSVFSLPVLELHTSNMQAIEAALKRQLATAQKFFSQAPVVLDLSTLYQREHKHDSHLPELDFSQLLILLRQAKMMPIALLHAPGKQSIETAAVNAGLAILHPTSATPTRARKNTAKESQPSRASTAEPPRIPSKIITETVRAGQKIYAQGCSLIVMATVNAGAEIVADGDIHVYGRLRGRALAGARGDTQACIFAQSFNGEMLVIAGNYRVFEAASPEAQGQAIQARLNNERLVITPITCFS